MSGLPSPSTSPSLLKIDVWSLLLKWSLTLIIVVILIWSHNNFIFLVQSVQHTLHPLSTRDHFPFLLLAKHIAVFVDHFT